MPCMTEKVKHELAENVAEACDNLMSHVDELDEQVGMDNVASNLTSEQYQTQLNLLHSSMDDKLKVYDEQAASTLNF